MPRIDPVDHKTYMQVYYHKKRMEIFKLLGNQCAVCKAFDDPQNPLIVCTRNLTTNSKTQFNLSNLWSMAKPKLKKVIKSKKCHLLCRVHRTEALKAYMDSLPKKPFKHGAYCAYFEQKCRCEECVQYHLNLVIQRREDRRDKAISEGRRPRRRKPLFPDPNQHHDPKKSFWKEFQSPMLTQKDSDDYSYPEI